MFCNSCKLRNVYSARYLFSENWRNFNPVIKFQLHFDERENYHAAVSFFVHLPSQHRDSLKVKYLLKEYLGKYYVF